MKPRSLHANLIQRRPRDRRQQATKDQGAGSVVCVVVYSKAVAKLIKMCIICPERRTLHAIKQVVRGRSEDSREG